MDFSLTPEIDAIRQRVRDFVDDRLIPLESDPKSYDHHENINPELLQTLRAEVKAAGLWCLFDLHYSDYDINVLLLNLAVGILNPVFGDTYHFLWHLLSASKALVVAYLIQREMRSRSERAPFIVHGFASNDENRNETWDPSMDAERQYSMPWP